MDLTLIVTYGRTGSTLLMRVLGQHPNVLIRSRFPFEARTAQYLFLAQRFGIEPLGRPLSYHGATYEPAGNRDDMFREIALEAVKSTSFPASMRQAYCRIANVEGQSGVFAIVEKAMGLVLAREMLEEFGSFRLISLIRNPRMTVRSIHAFNRRRGFLSFGEEAGVDVLMDNVIAFNLDAVQLAQIFAGRSHIVRYEDLLGQPSRVMEDVLRLHCLPFDRFAIDRMLAAFSYEDELTRQHKTSDTEVPPEEPMLSEGQIELLRRLGY